MGYTLQVMVVISNKQMNMDVFQERCVCIPHGFQDGWSWGFFFPLTPPYPDPHCSLTSI